MTTTITQRAVLIRAYGGAAAAEVAEITSPTAAQGQVLVRVRAAGVNGIDWKVREGHMKDFWPHKFPLILGWDLSGVVEELGRGVSRFKIGDEVYSVPDSTRNGAYADYIVVRESELALKPNSLHHIRAAAVPLGMAEVDRVLGGGLACGALHEVSAIGEDFEPCRIDKTDPGFATGLGVASSILTSSTSEGDGKFPIFLV